MKKFYHLRACFIYSISFHYFLNPVSVKSDSFAQKLGLSVNYHISWLYCTILQVYIQICPFAGRTSQRQVCLQEGIFVYSRVFVQ